MEFFLKRDDLIHPDFSGNKARKFHYYFQNDFPWVKKLISYGSNQSNAMYSMSVLAKLKKWEFIYFVDHLPKVLQENPNGNYKAALLNNMRVQVGANDCTFLDEDTLYIKEGGALKTAQYGVKILADEIKEWATKQKLDNLKVFLPSGTGTTALYLQKNLDFEVLTCPCVGDDEYLKKQFFELEKDNSTHPTILKPQKKFHFGKLYKENYEIWQRLQEQTSIEFDLLYDPIGWQVAIEYKTKNPNNNILYIHQGGLKGNITMTERYSRKYHKK